MQQAAAAYGKVAQTTQSPRELEATLLLRAAMKLQTIQDDWDARKNDLIDALDYNRKLWTVLADSMHADDNPLPDQIKENILKLAATIFQRTYELMFEPKRERVTLLVNINRGIAAGLRAKPAAGQQAA